MNTDVWIGKKSLRFLYYRYKDSYYYSLSLSVLIIVVCVVLFVKVVLPQTQNWFSIRHEVVVSREKVKNMQSNIALLRNLDTSVLNNQLQVVSSALPFDKDFGTILTALSDSALQSGVSFNDFGFAVGDIASDSAKTGTLQNGLASIDISVVLIGSVDKVKHFLQAIQKKLPLAEVLSINGDNSSTTIDIIFYQKPYPNLTFKDDALLPPVSNISLIEKLSSWQSIPKPDIIPSSGSSSAIPLF